tara:strand:+ start:370 stop:546 length:177 start_codon:yes stop_codon:yes gene_type:complete
VLAEALVDQVAEVPVVHHLVGQLQLQQQEHQAQPILGAVAAPLQVLLIVVQVVKVLLL